MLERNGAGRNAVIFHICDCPAHGKEFTPESFSDNYPDGPLAPKLGVRRKYSLAAFHAFDNKFAIICILPEFEH